MESVDKMNELKPDMSYQKGRVTMATIVATARFLRNFRTYFENHRYDLEFRDEVMFVMCDPQCHPPKTAEQLIEYQELLYQT